MPGEERRSRPVSRLDLNETRKRKRERIAIVLLGLLFMVLTIAEFRLTKVSSTLPFVNSIFFFGLLNINIIILIALVWLVFRNIGKLFIERRSRILGASLKTKLVMAFLAFSIIPTLVLFVISSLYINSSFDKWFSIKVQNTLQASLDITGTYYRNAERTAMHFAEHLSEQLSRRIRSAPDSETLRPQAVPAGVAEFLAEQRELLALNSVEFYSDPLDERVISEQSGWDPKTPDLPLHYPRLALDLLDRAFSGEKVTKIQHMGTGDLIRCVVPVYHSTARGKNLTPAGVVSVGVYIPVSLVNKVDEIASVIDDYRSTNPLQYPIKTAYFVILVMITLVIILVAIWIGIFLARELTVPVERLVHAAQAVGAGNLDVRIDGTGHDEIKVLVDSFNKMTRDLKENRERLTQAGADLEHRRLQLEAVLANVGTGVIVVDTEGGITTFNRAASQLLQVEPEAVLQRKYSDVLLGEAAQLVEVIDRAMERRTAEESATPEVTQWNYRNGEHQRSLAAIATSLRDSGSNWGAVVVIDDMTHLIKAQREVAWREVARRIAHEIKNPLTPIKLSAQRLQRRLGQLRGKDGELLMECTETIVKHTDELKEMVNEFSNFARFPEASPAPHDLNTVLGEVMTLFTQAHPEIRFKIESESRLPIFDFDRDQIKRVIMNLLDNAVAALRVGPGGMQTDPAITARTHYNEDLQIAVLSIEDNGPGMPEEVRERVFEPYFSTKKEGTGLGLAIAKRIVNDHDGFIRVHSAPGKGTSFSVELPTRVKYQVTTAETETVSK